MRAVSDLLLPPTSRSSSGGGSNARTNVDAVTQPSGETALCMAAQYGAGEIAPMLLAAGANPNRPRLADAVRPVDLAVVTMRMQMACLLIENGAEVRFEAVQAAPSHISKP
jgi:ankyrin repeat protein